MAKTWKMENVNHGLLAEKMSWSHTEEQHDLDKLGIAKNSGEEKDGHGTPTPEARGADRRTMPPTTPAWRRCIARSCSKRSRR